MKRWPEVLVPGLLLLAAVLLRVPAVGINDTPWNRLDDACNAAPRYPVVDWRKITAACTELRSPSEVSLVTTARS